MVKPDISPEERIIRQILSDVKDPEIPVPAEDAERVGIAVSDGGSGGGHPRNITTPGSPRPLLA
jgi:hypothetical protein